MHSRSLVLVLAAVLAGCGSTPQAKKKTSSSSGSTGASGSTGSAGSSGTTESSGSTGASSASGSSGGGSVGASSGSGSASGGTSASSSSGSSGAGTTTGGSCFGDSQYVGPGNGSQCCSGVADSGGYCVTPGGTTTGGTSGSGGGTTGSSICSTQRCVVYAHTAGDLYQIDPAHPNATTHLCSFSGLNSDAYDLAVRSDGALFVVTATALYQASPTTCQATFVANLPSQSNNFNGLAFTVGDVLLAVDLLGQVTSINTQTGATQVVGSYGGSLGSSGDLVTLSNQTIYATAHDNSSFGGDDILVTLDPNNGYAATEIGHIGYGHIYGLAYWAGNLYGFDDAGDVLQIDPTTGGATALAGAHSGLPWYGAGTTPLAPVIIR